MPNFDTSTIEGFDAMTPEQKVEALLKVEIPEKVDLSRYVSKETFDKKASEASALSKQLKDKMTDDEAKKADQDKLFNDMKEELQKLKDEKALGELTNHYLSLGYDKDLAVDTAKARMAGDQAKEFANGEKHRQALEKKLKEQLMDGTHKPDGAGDDDGKDKSDAAVERAKEIAKSFLGSDGQNYESTMKNYL